MEFSTPKDTRPKPMSEIIEIEEDWWCATLAHPIMTRLQRVKQLGNVSLVFKTAKHTRYEHSAGVGILISRFIPKKIEPHQRAKAIFSGLCHDLGHGPYSHSFEMYTLPGLGIEGFKHESMSVVMAEKLYDDLEDPPFSKKDLDLKNIFHNGLRDSNSELFFLVSNKASGFDMDRVDYIRRDLAFTGKTSEVNWRSLFAGIEWVNDFNGKDHSLCFEHTCINALGDMLQTRKYLFNSLYYHPKSTAMDLMIADLMIEGNYLFNIRQYLQDSSKYLTLDDSIVSNLIAAPEKSRPLQCIAERIQRLDLYEHCGSWDLPRYSGFGKFSKSEMREYEKTVKRELLSALDTIARPEELEIAFFSVNGMMDCHLDKILVRMPNRELCYLNESQLDTSHFDNTQEHYCMVFSKVNERAQVIKALLADFAQKHPSMLVARQEVN